MPIYEFACDNCSKTFEKLCSMSQDLGEIRCQYCQSAGIRKKMSGFATTSSRDSVELGGGGSSCTSCSSTSCSTCKS